MGLGTFKKLFVGQSCCRPIKQTGKEIKCSESWIVAFILLGVSGRPGIVDHQQRIEQCCHGFHYRRFGQKGKTINAGTDSYKQLTVDIVLYQKG